MSATSSTDTPPLPRPSIVTSRLPRVLYDELGSLIKGKVVHPDEPHYSERARVFNGNVLNASKVVACPLDAHDVSKIILFCTKHCLSLSVKAGGYGTAGWAINGDIIIDLSSIADIDIETPLAEGGHTSLRDIAPSGSKGKDKAGAPILEGAPTNLAGAKRRREDDGDGDGDEANPPPTYSIASAAVASFLNGPPLPTDASGEKIRQPPLNRRRVDEEGAAMDIDVQTAPSILAARQLSTDSESSGKSTSSRDSADELSHSGSTSTLVTSPGGSKSPETAQAPSASEGFSAGSGSAALSDPFAYMAERPTQHIASAPRPRPPASTTSASSSNAAPLSHSTLGSSGFPSLSSSRPDPFAYMTAAPTLPLPEVRSRSTGGHAGGWDALTSAALNHPLLSGATAHDAVGHLELLPVHKHAYVTFGAGVKQKAVDAYTAANPLPAVTLAGAPAVAPYHVPFSAHPVGSSVMILGGFGFLSRLYGLSIDNVVEVEMVLADGSIVIVNEREHPDLWWAIRGAGPAFGIATRYKARAYPVPVVFAGNLIYRFHRATAGSLIRHFRDCVKGAPRELYANVLLTAGPADKDSLVVVQICFVGPRARGQEYLDAISAWNGEQCLLNEVDEKSFVHQQESVAQVLRAKAGRQWFIRSALISSLPDDVINKTVLEFADTPIGCTWLFELAGGAIADFDGTCVPKSQREAAFTIAGLHQWDMGIDDPRCVETAEEWLRDTIGPVALGGPFPSFLGRHEPPARVMASFGANWARVAALKKQYDAGGVFRNTFWPLGPDGEVVEPASHEPGTP